MRFVRLLAATAVLACSGLVGQADAAPIIITGTTDDTGMIFEDVWTPKFRLTLAKGNSFTTADVTNFWLGTAYQYFPADPAYGPAWWYVDDNVIGFSECFFTAPGTCQDHQQFAADTAGGIARVNLDATLTPNRLNASFSATFPKPPKPQIESIISIMDNNSIIAETMQANSPYTLMLGGVPEPSTWALMIAGFGMIGATMRRKVQKQIPVGV